jgi:hypothetical protein
MNGTVVSPHPNPPPHAGEGIPGGADGTLLPPPPHAGEGRGGG